MAIVGLTFSKVDAERKSSSVGKKVTINTNIGVSEVSSSNIDLGNGKKTVKIKFNYDVEYQPEIGHIKLEGDVLDMIESNDAEKVLKEWTESKKVSKEYLAHVLKPVMKKCSIHAINYSEDLGLPSPIRLPTIGIRKTEEKSKSE